MFWHWESNNHVADINVTESTPCEFCEQLRPRKLLLQYRYSRIWYFVSWISYKQYFLVCDGCSRGVKLDSKEVEPTLEKNPVPLEKRFGWVFLVLIVVLLAGALIYSGTEEMPGEHPAIPYHQVLKQKLGRGH